VGRRHLVRTAWGGRSLRERVNHQEQVASAGSIGADGSCRWLRGGLGSCIVSDVYRGGVGQLGDVARPLGSS